MRRRFFVEKFEAGRAELRGDAAGHLGRVLRAEPGQLYELSDGKEVWLGRVERVAKGGRAGAGICFALVEPIPAGESALRVRLLVAIVKFDRFEWCLEKATELGTNEIVPLAAARSDRALVQAAVKRAERWRKILRESAQQSRCLRPPELAGVERPQAAFAKSREGMKLLLSERRDAPAMGEVLRAQPAEGAALAVGPEGGWTEEERTGAERSGFRGVSLGGNILRTETAVIAGLGILRYAWETAGKER